MDKTVLVTGSNGFIGRNLAGGLAGTYRVLAPKREELDLLDRASVAAWLDRRRPDVIVHCASIGLKKGTSDPERIVAANLDMFDHLASSLRPGQRMIHMGSGAEYGRNRPLRKVTEEQFGQCVPSDPYGFSKYEIARRIGVREEIRNLRLFGVYGPYEHPDRFITYAILQHLRREPVVIRQDVIFDYLQVGDLCRLVGRLIEQWPAAVQMNVTPSESVSLTAIAGLVSQAMGYAVPVQVLEQGLANEYTGSNKLIKSELKNFDFIGLRDGIAMLYDFLSRSHETPLL